MNIEITNPIRLRVRRVDEKSIMAKTIDEAQKTGKIVIRAAHGGSVANCYNYPADTEGIVVVATPDGKTWGRVMRLPANKVTLSGVFATISGYRGLFDDRFSDEKKKLIRRSFINSLGIKENRA